jgi:hypothetical protein
MDADRIWKWAEWAGAVFIAPLWAIAGTYYVAGTKRETVDSTKAGSAMTLPRQGLRSPF